ncbi:MAG: response regulator [Desulfovibrionaceae bacterium]
MSSLSSPQKSTVLIIEDSHLQAKIIRNHIQLYTTFPVLMAHTLADAESVLTQYADTIYVAVIDLNLPDAPDGEAVDLCLSWKVPSVVLTASFNEIIRNTFISKCVVDYFFKGSIQDMNPMITSMERIYHNQSVTVLVVDDSRSQRRQMRTLLEVQRLNVLEAADGVEALEVFAANPHVSLVITDFQMPHMDGLELIRELRNRYSGQQLAIIAVSAVGSGALTAQFLKNGANDFLTKPFEVEEFYWRVNQTLEMLDLLKSVRERNL